MLKIFFSLNLSLVLIALIFLTARTGEAGRMAARVTDLCQMFLGRAAEGQIIAVNLAHQFEITGGCKFITSPVKLLALIAPGFASNIHRGGFLVG
jgi:hypothetical protein